MESYSNSLARVPESSGNREDRLQRRRERERARRASETAEQREERLRVRRARDRARRAAQTAEESDANLSRTFLPLTPSRMTEQEAIRHSVQERQSNLPSTVAWPPTGETPINEFRTEGYISCAFPTLFPTGAADFVAPRACAVTIGNYFKHLLMYEDGRLHLHTVHLLYFVWYLIITYSTSFRPRQPRRTNHAARACASIAFELTLAPTMLCIHLVIIIGASAASPTLVVKTENCLYIYIYIYMVRTYSVYAFCPICARCNISTLHIKPLLAQEIRLYIERLNSGNQRNRDLKTVRKGRHY